MRTINEQLKDIVDGVKTPMDIISEGVHEYAIENYCPQTYTEGEALRALRDLYTRPEDKWELLDEEFSFDVDSDGSEAYEA